MNKQLHFPMIARLIKALNISMQAKIGGIIGTADDDKKLLDEISALAHMNYETNTDLNWLLANHPELHEEYINYRQSQKEKSNGT